MRYCNPDRYYMELISTEVSGMPIQVLLVGCNETFRATAAQLIGQLTHHVIALSDPQAALNVLSGIKFDVLVIGDLPAGTRSAGFLAAARALAPDLHVIGANDIARDRPAAAPPTLDAMRRAFAPVPHKTHELI